MSLPAVVELILSRLGLNSEQERENFLNPKYEDLADPFLMKDLERAVIRSFEAIEGKEKIYIYADYDCDGIPSASLLYKFFEKLNYAHNVSVYLPDRHDEGYGLHLDAVEKIIKSGATLIIRTDVGITAIDEVLFAQTNGVDVIVTDHHLPRQNLPENVQAGFGEGDTERVDDLPKAYAVVNPKQVLCKYPFKDLCGTGVAFTLIRGFLQKYGEYFKVGAGAEKWWLDLVAVATISDMVPLLGENRILAYWGMNVLRKTQNQGLRILFEKNNIKLYQISEDDIAFTLAPRINAASRMAHPNVALNVLISKDYGEAVKNVLELEDFNAKRKTVSATIMRKANVMAKLQELNKVLVIGEPDWHIGVLGIIAMKVGEQYKKSVMVWGRDPNGNIKGSARSFGDIHLAQYFTEFPENTFSAHGGHVKAGGFTVVPDAIYNLTDVAQTVYENHKPIIEVEQSTDLIIDTNLGSITHELYSGMKKLAPFGLANPKPIFRFAGVQVSGVKIFGKSKEHLELTVNDAGKRMSVISFFNASEPWVAGIYGKNITFTATLDESNFAGRTFYRLRLHNIE